MGPGEPGLSCHQLCFSHELSDGSRHALIQELNASFPPGSLSVITGPIGAGKTTLLHLLCALQRPTSGEVRANGQAISRFTTYHRDLWRRQVGLALQRQLFLDGLSVLENVMVPLVPRATSLSQAQQRALAQLESLELVHLAARSPSSLSGGERQRVTLARALVSHPAFLFADEPTAHQDMAGARLLLQRLQSVRDNGTTVVVVSHDQQLLAAPWVDQVWHLRQGQLYPHKNSPEGDSADLSQDSSETHNKVTP